MKKIKVGILGATGMVGQNYLRLLDNHQWFEVKYLAASNNSAGKRYSDAVKNRWLMEENIPEKFKNIIVRDVRSYDSIPNDIKLFFSAIDLENQETTKDLEFSYAKKGFAIVSNSSANRLTEDVPIIVPEINPQHSKIISFQQQKRSFPKTGFVVSKPNCSIQSYLIAIHALEKLGYPISNIHITTLQALSGAGSKGINDKNWRYNIIPYIEGEEKKTENETLKILGNLKNDKIVTKSNLDICATCIRVPVINGHTAVVSIKFKSLIPNKNEILEIWNKFNPKIKDYHLPSYPETPIVYKYNNDRPQVKLDVNNESGMAITIGRLEKTKFFDFKFIGLSHNTIRGAAGGAILTAELLVKDEYIKYD